MKSQPRSEKFHSSKRAGKAQWNFLLQGQVKKGRVFVGLSGGVDSAVSAALLKKEGYEVTGVFIKAWDPASASNDGHIKYPCSWKEDRRSAMRAAAVLGIPFLTLDLEKEYKEEVVDYMLREYKLGRTPNPDVMCNKEIKFGHFLKFALKNGADFVATGHYCQKVASSQYLVASRKTKNSKTLMLDAGYLLLEGADKNKDQSYFLWTLTQEQLARTLFPVGHLEKEEVRRLAVKFGLPQATRKDSQGLCFLGKIDMKEFLKDYLQSARGEVINEKGEVVGEHDGAIFYTIGERHGFTITKKTTTETPLYVVKKDINKNTITVHSIQTNRSAQMYTKEVMIRDTNFIGEIKNNDKLSCRIRYRQEKISCKIEQVNGQTKVIFSQAPFGVSPGQSLVLYQGEVCIGGGVMSEIR